MRGIRQHASDEEVDYFVDDYSELIESLLGVAFVICQTAITGVVSAAIAVERCCSKENHTAFTKADLLKFGEKFNADVTRIELLEALANYFKHHEEWAADWSTLTHPKSKRTADIVAAAGLASASTGNLRRGSTALGNIDFKSTEQFASIVSAWAWSVLKRIQDAVKI